MNDSVLKPSAWDLTLATLRLICFALFSAALHVTGWIVCAIAVTFQQRGNDRLPAWAWPWDDYHDSEGYRRWVNARGGTWVARYVWHAFKKPHQNWKAAYFGYAMDHAIHETGSGDIDVSELPAPLHKKTGKEGVKKRMVRVKSSRVYPYIFIVRRPLPHLFPNWCIRIKFGWEPSYHIMYGYLHDGTFAITNAEYCLARGRTRAKFSIRPFSYFHDEQ